MLKKIHLTFRIVVIRKKLSYNLFLKKYQKHNFSTFLLQKRLIFNIYQFS